MDRSSSHEATSVRECFLTCFHFSRIAASFVGSRWVVDTHLLSLLKPSDLKVIESVVKSSGKIGGRSPR